MDLLEYTIAVVIGGSLTLLGSYLAEYHRSQNEKFKFKLDKMISVGEEYYKLSTYSLIFYVSMIDNMDKREEFMSEGAHSLLNKIDEENNKLVEKIRENNITITTASFYFNVTDSEKAITSAFKLKEANLKMHHGGSIGDLDLFEQGREEFIKAAKSIVKQIQDDQSTITSQIKNLLQDKK